MSALDDYKRNHSLAVCVDSDGCAMDTMNIKHIRCFGPCMVAEWGLEAWRDEILKRWNEINLYSGTRGINRFKGLAMALSEINAQYMPIDGVEELQAWTDTAAELSNDAVGKEAARHPIFGKALAWSQAVNRSIEALPREEVKPFAGVKKALAAAHERADVIVVSSNTLFWFSCVRFLFFGYISVMPNNYSLILFLLLKSRRRDPLQQVPPSDR